MAGGAGSLVLDGTPGAGRGATAADLGLIGGGGGVRVEQLPRATWTPLDLVALLLLARRHWPLLLASGAAGAAAVLLALVVVVGPRYTVTAKLMVQLGPEMAASPLVAARDGAAAMPASRRPEDTATGVEILTNPRLIRGVVEHFGPGFFADAPAETLWQRAKRVPKAALRALREVASEVMVLSGLRPRTTEVERLTLAIGAGLSVEPLRRTDVIEVKLAFPDPRAGEALLSKYIELAVAGHVQAHRTPGVREFFDAGRAARRAELEEAERRLLAARTAPSQPVWAAAEQRALLLRAEADLRLQHGLAAASLAETAAEAARAEAELAALDPRTETASVRGRSRAGDDLRARLVGLRLDVAAQRARYAEDSPEVAELRRQEAAVLAALSEEPPERVEQVTTGANPLHGALARDLAALRVRLEGQRARADGLAGNVAEAAARVAALESAAVEVGRGEAEVARLRRALDLYERGAEDARVAEAMEAVQLSGLRVVMPPTAEILPSAPNVRRGLLVGLVGGLALAAGVLLLREFVAASRAGAAGSPAGDGDGPSSSAPTGTSLAAAATPPEPGGAPTASTPAGAAA